MTKSTDVVLDDRELDHDAFFLDENGDPKVRTLPRQDGTDDDNDDVSGD